MKAMNIFITGVGGQGIGLLTSVLTKACLLARYNVRGCDTHGLAQRGGTVNSHVRIGETLFSHRVPLGQADIVLGLERLETLRGASTMLKKNGIVIYYDAVYQPIHVRLGKQKYPSIEDLELFVKGKAGQTERVFLDKLPDPRMQNIALLGRLAGVSAIPGVTKEILEKAIHETLPPKALDKNLVVFRQTVS